MELINHKNAETYAITQRTSPRFLCCSTALLFFARAALAKNNNAVGRQRNLGLPTHQQQRRPSTLPSSRMPGSLNSSGARLAVKVQSSQC
jgi:hypothetical protein